MTTAKTGQIYLWFDTEFTTLELEHARLLQVAVMATDHNLRRVTTPDEDLCIFIRLELEADVSPWVLQNLPALVASCRSEGAVSEADADNLLCGFLDKINQTRQPGSDRPVLAGNSIHGDWFLARKFFPNFSSRVHYRHLDVTSVKLEWLHHFGGPEFDKENAGLIRQYFPEPGVGLDATVHDAHYDVIASAAELAFYRSGLRGPNAPQ